MIVLLPLPEGAQKMMADPPLEDPSFREGEGWVVYMTLSTCSLICSSSSFILTTMFCISAMLDLLPVVLISRPIS